MGLAVGPAFANDFSASRKMGPATCGGASYSITATGKWKDGTDTVSASSGTTKSSGNLSIPEDKQYRMLINGRAVGTFYS